MTTIAAQAAGLAADGYCVFPVRPGSKSPMHTGWQGEATADVERVAAMWRGIIPEPNIGIKAGGPLLVVDVDIKHGAPGESTWAAHLAQHAGGVEPVTRTVRTWSGGRQMYFSKAPDLFISGKPNHLGLGIDVRADGNLVLGPGSVFNGKVYELVVPGPILPAPAWLLELLTAKTVSPNGEAKFESAETPIIEGGRSDYLVTYAGKQRAIGHTVAEVRALVLLENERTCRPPLSSGEIDSTIMQSVARWEKGETPGVIRHGGEQPRRTFTVRSPDELAAETAPEPLAGRWLAVGGFGAIYGAPGAGKSLLATDLGLSLAAGIPWLDIPVIGMVPTLYVLGEGRLWLRMEAWRQGHPGADWGLFRSHDGFKFSDPAQVTALLDYIDHERPALVAFDTLATTIGGDENSSQDMGRVIDACL
jgi:Bifunctional DNA primase/polymerase, N-terminal/AAA domain/Primase C terminal 1 (PriCT-1)